MATKREYIKEQNLINKSYMSKWEDIEILLLKPNNKIPTKKLNKILDKLSNAYKDISEEEQQSIINNVYDDLFKR